VVATRVGARAENNNGCCAATVFDVKPLNVAFGPVAFGPSIQNYRQPASSTGFISTTAMIVLFWSRATRDLLKSFGSGIAGPHRLDTATKLPFSPPAP